LGALGRAAKSNLKNKIRYRASCNLSAGARFDELTLVTDEAVNCRNHYIHGSELSFDYERNFNTVAFFMATLEFVFAASDLIEAGWILRHGQPTRLEWRTHSNLSGRVSPTTDEPKGSFEVTA